MQVEVRYRLPGCGSVVDAEVECIRRVLLADELVRLVGKVEHGLALSCRGLEPRGDVPARHDEDVARAYGMRVPKGHRLAAFGEDLVSRAGRRNGHAFPVELIGSGSNVRQCGEDIAHDGVPVARSRLSPELSRRIPRGVRAAGLPAPVRCERQQDPRRLREGSGEMRDARIDGDHEIELGDERCGAVEFAAHRKAHESARGVHRGRRRIVVLRLEREPHDVGRIEGGVKVSSGMERRRSLACARFPAQARPIFRFPRGRTACARLRHGVAGSSSRYGTVAGIVASSISSARGKREKRACASKAGSVSPGPNTRVTPGAVRSSDTSDGAALTSTVTPLRDSASTSRMN